MRRDDLQRLVANGALAWAARCQDTQGVECDFGSLPILAATSATVSVFRYSPITTITFIDDFREGTGQAPEQLTYPATAANADWAWRLR